MILDTHLHIWDPGELDYGWLTPAQTGLYRRFDLDQARRAAGEVAETQRGGRIDGVVLVQAADSLAETGSLVDQAHRSDWVRGVVGWLPLHSPTALEEPLARFGSELRGVRHLTHDDPDPRFLLGSGVLHSLRLIARAGLVLDIPDAYPVQLDQVPEVARTVPDLRIVVDHLGKPPIGGDLDPWRAALSRAAAHPGVRAKLSGLATSVLGGANWSAGTVRPVLDHALAVFGPDRLMFGSDWPIAPTAGDYRAGTDVLLELIGELAPSEQHAILTGTAEHTYGL